MSLAPELYIADNKIVFDTQKRRIEANGKYLEDVPRFVYKVLEYYAARPDTPVPNPIIGKDIWKDNKNAQKYVRRALSVGRRHLGDKLGDPSSGAFRMRYKFGTMAVSKLGVVLPWPDESKALLAKEGALELNDRSKAIRTDGEIVTDVSYGEFTVLRELMLHQHEPLPREHLELAANFKPGSQTLRNTIWSLEGKLGFEPWPVVEFIEGQGYMIAQAA